MYTLLGISIALAALLSLNAVATLVAAGLWHLLAGRALQWAAATRAQFIFALRVFPALGAMACVLALLAPSYIAFEPETTHEVVSPKLAALAFFSAIGIGLAVWRGVGAWRATRRLVADWMRQAEAIELEGVRIPTYLIRHRFPVIAIVGAVRPRLFIAEQMFETLSAEEIGAAIRHERGHLSTYDNLKRTVLRGCRDALVIVPCGRSLDRAWAEAAEAAADEYAARGGAEAALDLASALVKIARIIPEQSRPTMPAASYMVSAEEGGVVWRVRRLTQLASVDCVNPAQRRLTPQLALWSILSLFFLALMLTAFNAHTLWFLHRTIEQIVSFLS